MNTTEFNQLLQDRVLVCDGAMGTMLYSRGVTVHQNFDGLNLRNPDVVREVHNAYAQAGVDIIETNTFGANRHKLREWGLDDQIADINQAGVRLAREALRGDMRVAGSIGPLGGKLSEAAPAQMLAAEEAFSEQAGYLLEAGVDLVILETFPGTIELICAVNAVRKLSENIPIIAQLTFNEDGDTLLGESAEDAAWTLNKLPVQVIGANCCVGPQPIYKVMERMLPHTDKQLSAQPNAGSPQIINHRLHYLTSPDYLGLYAKRLGKLGVRVLGGCCGTTPEHLRTVAEAARALSPRKIGVQIVPPPERDKVPMQPQLSPEEKSPLGRMLASRRFVVSAEISPPTGIDLSPAVRNAKMLGDAGVDAINIPDGPRATARMNPLSLAVAIQTRTSLEAILHVCCRDRNLLGLQADLIGAHTLGVRNILAVTGDPPKVGDYPDLHGVFEIDSVGLTGLISRLNQGRDLGDKPIKGRTRFLTGVGVNPASTLLEEEINHYRNKIAAGANFVLTQPVYEPHLLEQFLEQAGTLKLPTFAGILPLAGHRNAEFLHNEVPGMQIPQSIRDRMTKAGDGKKGRAEGVAIAREALAAARDLELAGVYIMPPLGRYELVAEVLK